MTDEARAFVDLGWNFARTKRSITAKTNTCAAKAIASSPPMRVEGFFSILKRGIYGVYQHVSEAHLHRYLNEFDFRYSNREKLGVNDTARASRLRSNGAKGRRLTYETTLFNGRESGAIHPPPQAPLALGRPRQLVVAI